MKTCTEKELREWRRADICTCVIIVVGFIVWFGMLITMILS